MATYSRVAVIYNPNSTGDSRGRAEALVRELGQKEGSLNVELIPTQHAGHAEELAREIGLRSPGTLIVSSSGDGGYHEVINGVMASGAAERVTTALLPAGNANDHWHHYHARSELAEQIVQGKQRQIDLIELAVTYPDKATGRRYAHSYAGLGLSPAVGRELNRTRLNRLNEIWIVLRALLVFRPVTILLNGQRCRLDSLVVTNVNRMGKHIKFTSDASLTSGTFEAVVLPHRSRWTVLWTLLRAATIGLRDTRPTGHMSFTAVEALHVQLDGEIFRLPEGTKAELRIVPAAIKCVI